MRYARSLCGSSSSMLFIAIIGLVTMVVEMPAHAQAVTASTLPSHVAAPTIPPDLTGPNVVAAVAEEFGSYTRPFSINIRFSELVDSASARSADNFTVRRLGSQNPMAIEDIVHSSALGTVIFLRADDPDWIRFGDYVVTINNVADFRGNIIAPDTTVPVAWTYCLTNVVLSSQFWDFHISAIFDPNVYDQLWFDCGYSPGPWWSRDIGPFYGLSVINASCPALDAPQTATGWQPEPVLFRTTFSYPARWPATATLYVRTALGAGLVLYLNGIEIFRNNVPGESGSPVHALLCSNSWSSIPSCITNIGITVTNLLPGTNCLAAAVCPLRSSALGPNLYFTLEMDASALIAPVLPLEPLPVLVLTPQDNDTVSLSWTGGGFALESSTTLDLDRSSHPSGPWTQVPQMSNPYLWHLTNDQPRFFRLKK